MIYMDRWS